MACSRPPALNDEQLLAWGEGDAAPEVTAHVQQCAFCRTRGEQLMQMQQQLAARLYRVACPSSLELGEYHLGILEAPHVALVEKHLAECVHCAREVQVLQGYLEAVAPTLAPAPGLPMPPFAPRMRLFVAKLVDHLSGLGVGGNPTPIFAGLRGEQDAQFVYEADDLQIIIDLQIDLAQPAYKALLGLVLGLQPDHKMTAQLQQPDQAPFVTPIDELGNFLFDPLAPGAYHLLLASPEREIWIENLQI